MITSHMTVILYSMLAIILGVIALGIGIYARRREHPYERYVLAVGGLLIALGVLGLLYFMVFWELAHR